MKNDTKMQIEQLMNEKLRKEAELEAIKKKLRELILDIKKPVTIYLLDHNDLNPPL